VQCYIDNVKLVYQAEPLPENCSNGHDDDADDLADCEDPDCYDDPACPCNEVLAFDVDEDSDVDQRDFAVFQMCYTGTGGAGFGNLPEVCSCLDVAGAGGRRIRPSTSGFHGVRLSSGSSRRTGATTDQIA
jgi:hypothetical protein